MRRILLSILFFIPIALLLSSEKDNELITIGPVPNWVKSCAFSLDSHPPKQTQVNLQYLLTDFQRNWSEKCCYFHSAIRPLSQVGVSYVAQVEIDFSPSYEHVIVHAIRIYRNGEWLERLQNARHQLLQRESELEYDLYSGDYTLVYFLDDVAEGDIVEYAYSIVGEMPYFSSHLLNFYYLQEAIPFDRLYRRLIASSEIPVQYKLFNTTVEPEIVDLGSNLREWSWELEDIEGFPFEHDTPSWFDPLARVEFSQYQTWKEVIEKLIPIYDLPEDFYEEPLPEMLTQVKHWMRISASPQERAFMALRFVQEKVRYLGFEEGLDGYKPHDPREVFQRKFGDCKDKTFLLHALLHMMDIDSTPTLVNTNDGKNLPEALPMPMCFDHIVLRIEIDENEYWVDSTMQYQGGGSLKKNFMPIYHWGLPISENSSSLVPMSGNFKDRATLIDTTLTLESEDKIHVKTVYTFFGHKADFMRRYLDTRGTLLFTEDALSILKKMYGNASALAPVTVVDDREKNVLRTTETYSIPTQKSRNKKVIKIYPSTIRNYLDGGFNPDRSAPYALFYPVWVKEHIHVDNSLANWNLRSDAYEFEHESLFYGHSYTMQAQECDIYYELHHLQDHVPLDSLRQYWEITEEIEEEALFQIAVLTEKKEVA